MSLKDSIKSAQSRVESTQNAANQERELITAYKAIIRTRIDKSIKDTASSVYKSICDAVADKIYINGNNSNTHIEGYVVLPSNVHVHIEDTKEYKEYASTVFYIYCDRDGHGHKYSADTKAIHDAVPDFRTAYFEDGVSYSIDLARHNNTGNEGLGIFGYHRRYSTTLTSSGKSVVDYIQRMAQTDKISIQVRVLYKCSKYRKANDERSEVLPIGRSYKCNSDYHVDSSVIIQYSYN